MVSKGRRPDGCWRTRRDLAGASPAWPRIAETDRGSSGDGWGRDLVAVLHRQRAAGQEVGLHVYHQESRARPVVANGGRSSAEVECPGLPRAPFREGRYRACARASDTRRTRDSCPAGPGRNRHSSIRKRSGLVPIAQIEHLWLRAGVSERRAGVRGSVDFRWIAVGVRTGPRGNARQLPATSSRPSQRASRAAGAVMGLSRQAFTPGPCDRALCIGGTSNRGEWPIEATDHPLSSVGGDRHSPGRRAIAPQGGRTVAEKSRPNSVASDRGIVFERATFKQP